MGFFFFSLSILKVHTIQRVEEGCAFVLFEISRSFMELET